MKECLHATSVSSASRADRPGMLTKVPKSVWAPMPALFWFGGVFTTLASLPLAMAVAWRSANAPLGRPRSRSKMSRIVLLTAIDFRTKGVTASCILSFTVGGYTRCVGLGQDSASSCAMFKNSTVSRVPCRSVAMVPRALYLKLKLRLCHRDEEADQTTPTQRSHRYRLARTSSSLIVGALASPHRHQTWR